MFLSRTLRTTVAAAGLALAAMGAASAPAQAQHYNNLPYEPCQLLVVQGGSQVTIIAQVAPGISGRYRLTANSATPGNTALIDQSGAFQGVPGRFTILSRALLSTAYIQEAGQPINRNPDAPRRMMDELREGMLGIDALLDVEMEVFDDRGRLVCRKADYQFAQMPARAQMGGPGRRPNGW